MAVFEYVGGDISFEVKSDKEEKKEEKYFEVKISQQPTCEASTQFEVTPGEQPPEQPPPTTEKKGKLLWLGLIFAGGLMIGLLAISQPKRRRLE